MKLGNDNAEQEDDGNSNQSFYYNCSEKIKIADLQKIYLDINPSRVVKNPGFERRLSQTYNYKASNSRSIPSNYLKSDSFGRATEQRELKRCH